MPEPDWKRYGYSSLESFVESKAGACPPEVTVENTGFSHNDIQARDWPMEKPPPFPADDEDDETPDA